MKNSILLSAAICVIFSCQQQMEMEVENITDASEKISDGVFIHISHGMNDPHRVVMALQMASMMSKERDVAVYFDIKGIEVVLKETGNIEYPTFKGSLESIEELKEKGISLMACPGCMKAAEKSPDDLLEGVNLADKETFFNFTKGRILTLDY
jgi:predicted peroxiredoxin